MRRSTVFASITLLLLAWIMPAAVLARVTADDFLPVAQGGPKDVKQPEKVAVKGNTVTAATAQDAVNAAEQKNIDDGMGAARW